MRFARLFPVVLAGVSAVAVACSDAGLLPTTATPAGPQFTHKSYPTLVECPNDIADSVQAEIGTLGGSLELRGSRVFIPEGALLLPTTIKLKIPASTYMRVDVEVPGVDHFTNFKKPISITMDFSRCTRNDIRKDQLSVWWVHKDSTKVLLERESDATIDTVNRLATWRTDHLSGWALAD